MTVAIAGQAQTVDETLVTCSKIDFEMIALKLHDGSEGPGWSHDRIQWTIGEYRRFLSLSLAFPTESIVPSKDVDVVWHAHILDTQAYARDCEDLFGFFLHHFPYLGLRGAEDEVRLERAYARTLELYAKAFGLPPVDVWGSAKSDVSDCSTPSECHGGSSPGGCTSRCTGG